MKKFKLAITISSLVLIIFAMILVHGIFNLSNEDNGMQSGETNESFTKIEKVIKEKDASIEVSSFVASKGEDAAKTLGEIKNEESYKEYLRKYLDNAYEKNQIENVEILRKNIDSRGEEIVNNYDSAYDERNSSGLPFKPGEVIVVAKKNEEGAVSKVVNENKGEIKEINNFDDTLIVKTEISLEDTVKRAVSKFETTSDDFEVQPNYIYKIAGRKEVGNYNDEDNKYNWYINKVDGFNGISEAKKYNNPKVKVAIIDTGVDIKHKSLKDNVNINDSVRVLDGKISKLKGDSEVHGTHVTGIITGKFNVKKKWGGIATDFVDTFVVDSSIQYNNETVFESADLIMSLDYAMKKGAKVINMSLGGFGRDNALLNQIQKCNDNDIVIVCAAGNENATDFVSPADFPNVISVISSTYLDEKAFSNYGVDKDISAPGEIIYSTIPGNRFMYSSGTSMAAPVVTSVCALIRYVNPKLDNDQVRRIVYSSSDDIDEKGFDIKTGFGRVNTFEAVNLAVAGSASNYPQNIEVNKDKIDLVKNLSTNLEVNYPDNKNSKSLIKPTFESENAEIAWINDFGIITGVSKGKTNVLVKAGYETIKIPVNVNEPSYYNIKKSPYGKSTQISFSSNTGYYSKSDWYSYIGSKGEIIDVSSDSFGFDTGMDIYDDNGNMLTLNPLKDEEYGFSSRKRVKLKDDGKIFIEVFNENESKYNNYKFKFISSITKTKISTKRINSKTVNVMWKPIKGVDGYVVFKSKYKTKDYKVIKVVSKATSKSANITKVSKKYYYKVMPYRSYYEDKRIYGGPSNIAYR